MNTPSQRQRVLELLEEGPKTSRDLAEALFGEATRLTMVRVCTYLRDLRLEGAPIESRSEVTPPGGVGRALKVWTLEQ